MVAHVGTKDRDPVQARRAQSGARAIGMSDRDADRRSLVNEALRNAPTEETAAPEHAYRGHGINRGETSVATLRVQTEERRNETDSPEQDSTPSLPGMSNENKADPTDQNNPK